MRYLGAKPPLPQKRKTPDQQRRALCRGSLGWLVAIGLPFLGPPKPVPAAPRTAKQEITMDLPRPNMDAGLSVAAAIRQRRTVRAFAARELSQAQLAQLLWAAQGITGRRYKRAAPSAGALYPMDLYAVVGTDGVQEMAAGVYHYRPEDNGLTQITGGDFRLRSADAALGQRWMAKAPINLVITAEYARVAVKYRERGTRYAVIEAGCIGQNIFLQAEALGLKAGMVGAFRDQALGQALEFPPAHEPLLIMPVGYAR
jgi:SagB-type dehydrogenase family enzyme